MAEAQIRFMQKIIYLHCKCAMDKQRFMIIVTACRHITAKNCGLNYSGNCAVDILSATYIISICKLQTTLEDDLVQMFFFLSG